MTISKIDDISLRDMYFHFSFWSFKFTFTQKKKKNSGLSPDIVVGT